MKTILFSLSILCFTSAIAQEKEAEPNLTKPSKFTFGWVYSPEVAYRILSESESADGITQSLINSRNNNEQAKFGQSFSFFWGYKLSKTFVLEGGLGYTDFGEALKPYDIFNGPFPEDIYATVSRTNRIHVANLPITLHVNLGGNRVQGFISAGVAPGLMMRTTSTVIYDYPDGGKTTANNYYVGAQENFSKFILGAHISGGVDYKYSEKASLRIAPVFRITATDTYSGVPIKANYFNAGIEFGTVYKL